MFWQCMGDLRTPGPWVFSGCLGPQTDKVVGRRVPFRISGMSPIGIRTSQKLNITTDAMVKKIWEALMCWRVPRALLYWASFGLCMSRAAGKQTDGHTSSRCGTRKWAVAASAAWYQISSKMAAEFHV